MGETEKLWGLRILQILRIVIEFLLGLDDEKVAKSDSMLKFGADASVAESDTDKRNA